MAKSSGKYFADVMQGNVFHGVTAAAGTTFPLSTGTAMTFGLWNVTPNKNGVLLGLNAGFTSGTLALGEVGLTAIYGGYALATANNITAFTNGVLGTTIFNAQIGYGAAPAMRFTPSAATVVANVASYWTGLSAITASTVSTINWNARLRWQGDRAAGLGCVRHRLDCSDGTVLHVPDLGGSAAITNAIRRVIE
jgi:hypothetical protein